MLINWPHNLIGEIANRRAILFLGAGISACATNDSGQSPLTWGEFIRGARALITNPTSELNHFLDEMIQQQNFLMALQVIYNNADPGNYNHYLTEVFRTQNYRAGQVHQYIKEIDSKILITTNFDKIYDNLCSEHVYTVATYTETEKILTNIKSTANVIIKAHGSIDEPTKMVFTQEQYNKARMENPKFYRLLNALFLTNTVLFLGYSLNDPDINLILENVANTTPSSNPHYIVVKEGVPGPVKEYWLKSYNIVCLEYGPDHTNFQENIENLWTEVLDYRISRRIP